MLARQTLYHSKDCGLRPAQANSFQDPCLQTNQDRTKWTGGMAQVSECLLCKVKALSSTPFPLKKKKKKERKKEKRMCQTDTGMVVHVCNPSKKKNAKIFSE
jgi:hypothetical protein